MATGSGDPVFLDTNVLVYAAILTAPAHQDARRALQKLYDAGTE